MTTPDLSRYDVLLTEGEGESAETHGYLVAWQETDSTPFALVVEEQAVPETVSGNQEDENYGFRDLQDTWRLSFTNFSGGEGQKNRDVAGGSISRYDSSLLIDNSEEGVLKLHHSPRLVADGGYSTRIAEPGMAVVWRGKIAVALTPFNPTTGGAIDRQMIALYDPQTGVWSRISHVDTAESLITAMCSDGEKLYASYAGGSVASQQGLFSYTADGVETKISDDTADGDDLGGLRIPNLCKLVNRMAFSAGVLYLSTGSRVGYLKSDGTFEVLSIAALITPAMTCFGLEPVGSWVYWGVTSGGKSTVFAVQWDGSSGAENFLQFVELPTGFVGTSLIGYLGNLYIAGYYLSNEGGVGQGAVYFANEQGVSLLTKIGDEPNDDLTDDRRNNQIVAGYAYDHYIYLLTGRSLYRWDVRKGGLNHVFDPGTFSASSGDTGTLVYTPWDLPRSWWSGYTHEQTLGTLDPPLPEASYSRFTSLYDQDVSAAGITYYKSGCETGDKHGNDCYHHCAIDSSLSPEYGDFTLGGTLQAKASHFSRGCFEMFVSTRTVRAQVSFYGRANFDQILVYYMDKAGKQALAYTIPKKADLHDLQLVCDPVTKTGRLWVDGKMEKEWPLAVSAYYPGIGITYGNHLMPSDYVEDWTICLRYLRWAGGGAYDPTWVGGAGVTGATIFPVLSSSPWIPVTTGTTKGLMAFDWERYPSDSVGGYLWTSESSNRMPTVTKYMTAIDVHHDICSGDERIVVTPYVDDSGQPPLVIDRTSLSHVTSLGLRDASGSDVKLLVELFSGGSTTPRFRGASLRFSPVDNAYYLFQFDLQEQRRDNTNFIPDTEADLAFIKRIAASKSTVTLTTALESCQVRVGIMRFKASPPIPAHSFEPQGVVVVKMKKVP